MLSVPINPFVRASIRNSIFYADLRAGGGWLKPYYGAVGVRFHLIVPMLVTQPWTAHRDPLWPSSIQNIQYPNATRLSPALRLSFPRSFSTSLSSRFARMITLSAVVCRNHYPIPPRVAARFRTPLLEDNSINHLSRRGRKTRRQTYVL